MIRRFNLSRSDNFPVCSIIETILTEVNGSIFIYTGFEVKSVVVTKIKGSPDVELFCDPKDVNSDGFNVFYKNAKVDEIVKFSYQAQ